jgi:hypothetical protein
MHKIYNNNNKTFIERTEYPRFRAEITFDCVVSDLENIEWIDEEPAPSEFMLIARLMREAGDYISNYNSIR